MSQHTDEVAAVLLLAHGTPNALGEMAEYLGLVTGGRTLPHEVVEELQHRYAEIGLGETAGSEPPPLTHWTMAQRKLLESLLASRGTPVRVYAGMRNWHPLIAEVVAEIRADGVTRLTALCLAPQNSRTSIGLYRRALTAALAATAPEGKRDPLTLAFVDAWPEEPALVEAFAEKLRAVYARAVAETGTRLPVLFTAHSVPCRTIMASGGGINGPEAGSAAGPQNGGGGRTAPSAPSVPDPYPVQAKRTAALVFEAAFGATDSPGRDGGEGAGWFFAFQSQGVAGGPWIGPTVEDTLAGIAAEGYPGVILQPIGFVCDHVEVLYDIDVAFQQTARSLNLRLYRAESLNDSPMLTDAIANVLRACAP